METQEYYYENVRAFRKMTVEKVAGGYLAQFVVSRQEVDSIPEATIAFSLDYDEAKELMAGLSEFLADHKAWVAMHKERDES